MLRVDQKGLAVLRTNAEGFLLFTSMNLFILFQILFALFVLGYRYKLEIFDIKWTGFSLVCESVGECYSLLCVIEILFLPRKSGSFGLKWIEFCLVMLLWNLIEMLVLNFIAFGLISWRIDLGACVLSEMDSIVPKTLFLVRSEPCD